VSKVIPLSDNFDLVETKEFKLAHFPFSHFNPIQSGLLPAYDKPGNVVISTPTSSGKTICAELLLAHEIKERGGKGVFVGPLKSLSQEQIDNWRNDQHHFSGLNVSICTGDYRYTPDRKAELAAANFAVMTYEMLNSRLRNNRSEHNDWLNDIGTLVVDEAHSLMEPGRGASLEVALMQMTRLNPDCRIMFLSATMPNTDEISEWLASVTGRDTYLLKSKYRPVPVYTHFKPYDDSAYSYHGKIEDMLRLACYLVDDYPDDKFLIFTHSKAIGKRMVAALEQNGIETDFHNANVAHAKRLKLEDRFRNDPTFRILVATSTLAQGLNMPARRVIILDVRSGLALVPNNRIEQMVGRAGRPQYDDRGDAYVLLPDRQLNELRAKLDNPTPIESQLVPKRQKNALDGRTLAFHLINEMHQQGAMTFKSIQGWYSRSLAYHQGIDLASHFLQEVLESMDRRGLVTQENGEYTVTKLGQVASLFYFPPFDTSDLKRHFTTVFRTNCEASEAHLAVALADIDSHICGGNFVSRAELEEIEKIEKRMPKDAWETFLNQREAPKTVRRAACCYYLILKGQSNGILINTIQGMRADSDRLVEVLKAVDNLSARWSRQPYFDRLRLKLRHGCAWYLIDLCEIPNIGPKRAHDLWIANLKTPEVIASNPQLVQNALKCSEKMRDKIVESAKTVN